MDDKPTKPTGQQRAKMSTEREDGPAALISRHNQ
jgi:hypothetical protein